MAGHITQEQADEFAIGALDVEIAQMVALHADDCAPCGGMVRQSERAAVSLLLGVKRTPPPAGLRRRVMRSAGILRPGPLAWGARLVTAGAGIAAVFVAIAAFTGMVSVRGQVGDLRRENAELQTKIDDALGQKVQIVALTQGLKDEQQLSAELLAATVEDRELTLALLSPETNSAFVFPVNERTSAVGRLVWDEGQKKVWFVASGLERLPEGETYQVWVDAGGRYIPLGTFNADETGFARYAARVPQGLTTYDSAVVTIERSPGSSERSGPSVFVSDLSPLRR
ncbi:MAG: anti-sigma factor [Dehalococcoidia bacterium]